MTITVVILGVLLILPILWCLTVKFSRLQRMLDKLPTPPSLPILGHAHILPLDSHEFYKKMFEICGNFRKGGIFTLNFGFLRRIILVTRANVADRLLQSSKHITKSDLYDFAIPWLGTGLLIARGDKWRTRRRLITPSFHYNILQDFLVVMNEQATVLVNTLKSKNVGEGSFDICPYISHCTLDIICLTAMGKHVNAQGDGESEYVKAVQKATELIIIRVFRPWLWPDVIYNRLPAGKEMKRKLDILHDFTTCVITERMEEHKHNTMKSTAAVGEAECKKRHAFLELLEQADENKLCFEDIREEVDTFMFEGHDTTSSAIVWAIHLLGAHPEVQGKVQEELDEVFGDSERNLTYDDLPNLKYMECVIKESQRMFPSVPMIGRELEEDIELGGFRCPKGARVLIVITELHCDPLIFPEPKKFDPDRFKLENAAGRHPFAYVPFSAGPRNCIGQKFAVMEEKAVLSALLRNFNIEAVQQTHELEPCNEMILRPGKGVHCKLTPRRK